MLHLFAMLVAATTGILIFAGGLVTSTESGLSVPDWPNTYGYFMFFFPLDKMVGGIRFEHTHRLIASTVGFLILVLAVWLWRSEPRLWVRRLGYIALAGLPPGTYTIEAWHEKLGTQMQMVTIGAKESKTITFAFKV